VTLFLRLLLGVILLTTGLGKLLDVPGFIGVIHTYRALPNALVPALAVVMVLVELRLAEMFLLGKSLHLASGIATFLHAFFIGWAGVALLRGLDIPNCGCFGVFLARPLSTQTIVEDVVMAGLCLWLWYRVGLTKSLSATRPAT
jgi:hypothetical protein